MLGLNSLAWLALLVWIGVPILSVLVAVLVLRQSKSASRKTLALASAFVILSVPALISNGVKAYYDSQVRELCAKDGGVKVYEVVRLSVEEYEALKRVNFVLPDKMSAKATDHYFYETDRHYYKEGHINFLRTHHQIIRRIDGKVLGESIRYGRSGGDLPGPWHHSSFMCPDPASHSSAFATVIFIRGNQE